jgi:hypothetical protein
MSTDIKVINDMHVSVNFQLNNKYDCCFLGHVVTYKYSELSLKFITPCRTQVE